MKSQQTTVRYEVAGARRLSNFIWGIILSLGGTAFLLTGLSSYFSRPLIPFVSFSTIQFFPQGLVMCFYGTLGILLATYIWLILLWNLGQGFNNLILKDDKLEFFDGDFPEKTVVLIYNTQLMIFKVSG